VTDGFCRIKQSDRKWQVNIESEQTEDYEYFIYYVSTLLSLVKDAAQLIQS